MLMGMKFYSALFAFVLFTLLAVNVAALVPSESALQATQPYLRGGEAVSYTHLTLPTKRIV